MFIFFVNYVYFFLQIKSNAVFILDRAASNKVYFTVIQYIPLLRPTALLLFTDRLLNILTHRCTSHSFTSFIHSILIDTIWWPNKIYIQKK